jgi:hypothetical protein
MSEKVVSLPIGIHGRHGTIEAAVIKGDAPLLLSRSAMNSLGAVMNFAEETLSIQGGPPRPLTTNAAGQFMIDVMSFSAPVEALVSSYPEPCNEPQCHITMKENRCLMAQAGAWDKMKPKTDDYLVAEPLSPPRFSQIAEEQDRKGLAFDILQGWDLNRAKTQSTVDKLLNQKRPELLVACPPCTHWGGWFRLNQQHLTLLQKCHLEGGTKTG